MKSIKFSRLFAAVTFVAIFALAGCKQPDEETPYSIEGTWVCDDGQKFEITHNELKNYYVDYITHVSSFGYAGDNLVVEELSANAGTIFIKYTRAGKPDWSGYSSDSSEAPDVGKWYAVSYKSLTDTSAEFAGAWKDDGESSCDTLEEAKAEFTSANGYYGSYNTFVKQ